MHVVLIIAVVIAAFGIGVILIASSPADNSACDQSGNSVENPVKDIPPDIVPTNNAMQERLFLLAEENAYSLFWKILDAETKIPFDGVESNFNPNVYLSAPKTAVGMDGKTYTSVYFCIEKGYYAGPIILTDENGNDVKIIKYLLIVDGCARVPIDASLAGCKINTLQQVSPKLKQMINEAT
ncbi:MAG: hypothetical protein M0P49_00065 [Bacilli bacterium]|nr:hypothetical protein [Bacilli bacterium]